MCPHLELGLSSPDEVILESGGPQSNLTGILTRREETGTLGRTSCEVSGRAWDEATMSPGMSRITDSCQHLEEWMEQIHPQKFWKEPTCQKLDLGLLLQILTGSLPHVVRLQSAVLGSGRSRKGTWASSPESQNGFLTWGLPLHRFWCCPTITLRNTNGDKRGGWAPPP